MRQHRSQSRVQNQFLQGKRAVRFALFEGAIFGAAFVFAALSLALPTQAWAKRDYAPHSGYLNSTEKEREASYVDLVVIQPPAPLGPNLNERIFNDKLVKEFRERYEEKFGRTEVERVYNSPNRFTYYQDLYGFKGTPEEMNNEKKSYADFVTRRLLEYHIDNYAQNDPKLKPAWEAKERLKEFKVEIQQFRFDMQYSIAGNTFDMKVINPYLSTSRVRLQMDPGVFGPAPVQDTIISLGRAITPTVEVEGHWATGDGIISFVGKKALSPVLGTSLSTSTFTKEGGKTRRESRYLAGLSYIF